VTGSRTLITPGRQRLHLGHRLRKARVQHRQRLAIGALDQVGQLLHVADGAFIGDLQQLGLLGDLRLGRFWRRQLLHCLCHFLHRLLQDFHVTLGDGLRAFERHAVRVRQHFHVLAVRGHHALHVEHGGHLHFAEHLRKFGHLGHAVLDRRAAHLLGLVGHLRRFNLHGLGGVVHRVRLVGHGGSPSVSLYLRGQH